jgi:hypothetical protein
MAVGIFVLGVVFGYSALHEWVVYKDLGEAVLGGVISIVVLISACQIWRAD